MTHDEALKRINLLEKEVKSLREFFASPPTHIISPYGWWLFLDEYEIVNLKAALAATGYECADLQSNPLDVLMSGDWLGQIYNKLDKIITTSYPNFTAEEYRQMANGFIS